MENKLSKAIVIRQGDNLNKINFWSILENMYPDIARHFHYYLKGYEKKEEWMYKFDATEFWECPIEMQFGVILHFFGTEAWPRADIQINMGQMICKEHWIYFICQLFTEYANMFPPIN